MQYFSFKDLLLSLVFFLTTCHKSEPVVVHSDSSNSNIELIEPKVEDQEDYREVSTKLTLILLDSETLFAYEGNEISSGARHRYDALPRLLKASREKFGEKDFAVLIKPTTKATYQQTVDVLDAMTTQKIKQYHIIGLFPEEKQILRLD